MIVLKDAFVKLPDEPITEFIFPVVIVASVKLALVPHADSINAVAKLALVPLILVKLALVKLPPTKLQMIQTQYRIQLYKKQIKNPKTST